MAIRRVQQGFVGGELSPDMYGRFDDGKYTQGLAVCKNFICLPQGPVVNRPGTAFVRQAKYNDRACRLIPFIYSNDQTMCLEFGHHYVRFHTQGATLLGSNGQPYEVETPYDEADLMDIHYVQSIDVITLVHPAYAPRELRRHGATDWRLQEIQFRPPITPPTINEVTYSCGDSAAKEEEKTRYEYTYKITSIKDDGGVIQESSASAPKSVRGNLYINSSYNTLKWSSVAGASRYRVYKSYKGLFGYIGETEQLTFIDDNYSADESQTPPIYDDTFSMSKGIESVSVTNQGSGYVGSRKIIATENGGQGKSDYDVPAQRVSLPYFFSTYKSRIGTVKVIDEAGSGSGAIVEAIFANPIGYSENYITGYKIVSPGSGYVRPKIQHWSSSFINDKWRDYIHFECNGIVDNALNVEALVSDPTGSGALLAPVVQDGRIVSIRVKSGGTGYSNPTVRIVSNVGSGATATARVASGKVGDYPGSVTYHEQRRCFAGTYSRPLTLWMTRPGTETDMSYTMPSKDDNRLRFQIMTLGASRILHLVPLAQLLALTESSEVRISLDSGDTGSGASISAKPQARNGASNVQPVVVNSAALYVAARGNHVMEIGYNWQASGFVVGDLSIRASHLFDNISIKDIAFSKTPYPLLWAVTDEGNLLGFTYLPDQNVGAWHQHVTVNGSFESVCVVPEGKEDILYVAVRRRINGSYVRYIERMHEQHYANLQDCFYVDCGATYDGEKTTTIKGLNWLEGETVAILANGCVLPKQIVKDGQIKLSQPSTKVQVGLPITSDLRTLPAVVQLQDGSFGVGHMKNINEVWARLYRSSGFFAGPDFDKLVEFKQRTTEPYGSPPRLISQEIALTTQAQWTDTGNVCIRQVDPLPLRVVSIAFELAE